MRYAKKAVITALVVVAGLAPSVSFADERLEGQVVRAELTLCHPRPTGGGCEGILTLETKADGSAKQVAIKVIADTIIKKGPDYLLLPATQGQLSDHNLYHGKRTQGREVHRCGQRRSIGVGAREPMAWRIAGG